MQSNRHVRGKNIDINKLKARAEVQHFFFQAFKTNYIAIWSSIIGRCDGGFLFVGAIKFC
jgi:hypothetical protein